MRITGIHLWGCIIQLLFRIQETEESMIHKIESETFSKGLQYIEYIKDFIIASL